MTKKRKSTPKNPTSRNTKRDSGLKNWTKGNIIKDPEQNYLANCSPEQFTEYMMEKLISMERGDFDSYEIETDIDG